MCCNRIKTVLNDMYPKATHSIFTPLHVSPGLGTIVALYLVEPTRLSF